MAPDFLIGDETKRTCVLALVRWCVGALTIFKMELKEQTEALNMSALLDEVSTIEEQECENELKIVGVKGEISFPKKLSFDLATIDEANKLEKRQQFFMAMRRGHRFTLGECGFKKCRKKVFDLTTTLDKKIRMMTDLAEEIQKLYCDYCLYHEYMTTMERKLREADLAKEVANEAVDRAIIVLDDAKNKARDIGRKVKNELNETPTL
jgi:hypothetical protein